MERRINKSINEARDFFETSLLEIPFNGDIYYAFPHFKYKERATEYGGTSSALATLGLINVSSDNIRIKTNRALQWLYLQQLDGAWQSSNIYCAEVTAGVLCDLYYLNSQNDIIEKACNYLKSCYNSYGYFNSKPEDTLKPRIYTTYICLKALKLHNKMVGVDIDKIKTWVNNSKSVDENWGIFPVYNHGTVSHTIFALFVLSFCGLSFMEIKKQYNKQIKWIERNIKNIELNYESEEIRYKNGVDINGDVFLKLLITHNCSALLGDLLICLEYKALSTDIAKRIISTQYNGGWGPEQDKQTMWATQQNIMYLVKFKDFFSRFSLVDKKIYAIHNYKTKVALCIFGGLILAGSILWILLDPSRIQDAYLSIFLSIVFLIAPWFFRSN